MNKIHEIFPTIVYQGEIKSHQEFKNQYLSELKEYWFDGYENESPENSEKIFLHHNLKYQSFFKNLLENVYEYLNILDVDVDKFNFYVTKSWIGYHKNTEPTLKMHNHNASNISFCYYLSSNHTSDKFCIHQISNTNEVSEGIFESHSKFNTIKKFNKYNCNQYTITPIEGSVLIFPGSLLHSTLRTQEMNGERIVIAGDIFMSLKKEYQNHHQSIVDPFTWTQINNS
jgi:hypothetical protein